MDIQIYKQILENVDRHSHYRNECLNLIASENTMSPTAQKLLSTDLVNRYAVGLPYNRWFPGLKHFDRVEEIAQNIFNKLFHAKYSNVQAPTGTLANFAAYLTLLKPNDLVLSLDVRHGGHYSHVAGSILSLFNIKVEPLPFCEKTYTVDIEKAKELIRKRRPKMVILGTMEFLFPPPLKQIRDICSKTDTKILYDASHVSGLIAGQIFQNPLDEGADIMTLATNKTLSAPSHGIVACNDISYSEKIENAIAPLLSTNNHAHHIAALAMTLAEFEEFGHNYAVQIVKNAKSLAKSLYKKGVRVLCPEKDFTESHMILLDSLYDAKETVRALSEANIMANSFKLPWNNTDIETGIRLGTSEVTRLGMKEEEMEIIAEYISAILFKRASISKINKEVRAMRKNFQTVNYCFNYL